MSHWTASLFASGMESIAKNRNALIGAMASVIRYPIKAVAAFVFAPLLAFRVARLAKNPVRRAIASVGLFLAIVLAWLAGTLHGTLAGALFVLSKFGLPIALGFLLGTTLSITLSVAFSIFVLNATSWLFLKLSSEDVIAHLKSISE